MSVIGGRAENICSFRVFLSLTQIGFRHGSTNAGRSALSTSTVTIDHAASRDVPVMHSTTIPVDMTIVCIDILERISLGESQIERTGPLSRDIVASGLD
jgi:CxxC motif-containing protein